MYRIQKGYYREVSHACNTKSCITRARSVGWEVSPGNSGRFLPVTLPLVHSRSSSLPTARARSMHASLFLFLSHAFSPPYTNTQTPASKTAKKGVPAHTSRDTTPATAQDVAQGTQDIAPGTAYRIWSVYWLTYVSYGSLVCIICTCA